MGEDRIYDIGTGPYQAKDGLAGEKAIFNILAGGIQFRSRCSFISH